MFRRALEAQGGDPWMDQRELPYSGALEPDLRQAIERASHVVALVSVQALNSGWVAAEIRHALEVQKTRGDDYRVIAVLCPPREPQGRCVRANSDQSEWCGGL